jgi:predicted O-linked N-acetylglucosamine transferase (SPINDLY family)
MSNESNLSPSCPPSNFTNICTYNNSQTSLEHLQEALIKAIDLAEEALLNGRTLEAKSLCMYVLQYDPQQIDCWHFLGLVALMQGEFDVAEELIKKAISLDDKKALFHINLGNVYYKKEKIQEAYLAYQKGIELNPNLAEAYSNLSNVLSRFGELQNSIEVLHKAIKLNPNIPEAYNNLAGTYRNQGLLPQSIQAYSEFFKVIDREPIGHSNYLMTLLACSGLNGDDIFKAHCNWSDKYAKPLEHLIIQPKNCSQQNRLLKIGYVSGDFREHSVAYFFDSIITHHDRNKFEIFCYANQTYQDQVTERFKSLATAWRNIYSLSDTEAAQLIRDDEIDILIDLSGHSNNNRLLVFAQKPAPIQMTYIGYPSTTGLPTIDYRITDLRCDPKGYEKYYTEQLIRLPLGFLSFTPSKESPPVRPFNKEKQNITFGSFNALYKVTEEVVSVWAQLIKSVPNSNLFLKNKAFLCSATKQYWQNLFAKYGLEENRVTLAHTVPSKEHLDLYNQIDIALDPFPYNGTTTSCEALWMGVPIVTLEGNTHVSRVGVSLLHSLNLNHLIASSYEEYIQIASDLAKDRDQLFNLRASIRQKILNCALGDGKKFIFQLETAYTEAWQKWCITQDKLSNPNKPSFKTLLAKI